MRIPRALLFLALFWAFSPCQAAIAGGVDPSWIQKGARESFQKAREGLKKAHESGSDVMTPMVRAYESSKDPDHRAWIAELWYGLNIESKEAKRALIKDLHTEHQHLRLQVQWALGRVSADEEVVDKLLDNMMNDKNPLFRDKSACALAYDQIHLTPKQKVKLYAGLIQGLGSENQQVRQISLQAIQIHTGQNKGFDPNAAPALRQAAIEAWRKWLEEYKSNL